MNKKNAIINQIFLSLFFGVYTFIYYKIYMRVFSNNLDQISTLYLSFKNGSTPLFLFYTLYKASFGSIIAFPDFYRQIKKTGKFQFQWFSFIFLSIPSLFIALGLSYDIAYLDLITVTSNFIPWLSYDFARSLFTILFGYISVRCFKKI